MSRRVSDRVRLLLNAYEHGAFPMAASRDGAVDFYTADPRAIVPLEPGALRLPRSLRARVRQGAFTVTADRAFERVVRACADAPRKNPDGSPAGTWINDWIIAAYAELHRAGYGHSVEAWVRRDGRDELVGGLYGVAIGGAFFGESMFSRPDLGGTDASKVCFAHLVEHLRRRGFVLLDTQFTNPHMERLGVVEIPLHDYMERLRKALTVRAGWGAFTPATSDPTS